MSIQLRTAFVAAGGQATVARLLGVSRSTVNTWLVRGVPVQRCPALEAVTQGIVNRQLARPHDWHIHWPELAYAPGRHPARQGINRASKRGAC